MNKILKMLGGEDSVSRVLEREHGRFQLSLNLESSNEHGLRSNVEKSGKKRVVVRMSDPPTIVGVVDNTHVFNDPSDLQYFGSGKRKRKIDVPEGLDESFFLFENQPILPIPSRFLIESRITTSENLLASYRKKMKTQPRKKKRATSPVPAVKKAKLSTEAMKRAKKFGLDKLFDLRPCWSTQGIDVYTGGHFNGNQLLRKVVSFYASYYQGGPWGRVWVRNSYEPNRTRESRMFQAVRIDVRVMLQSVSPDVRNRFGKKVDSLKLTYMGRILKSQNYYCLAEICECSNEIKGIVESAPLREFCHEKDGWFQPETLSAVDMAIKRDIVKTFQDTLFVDEYKADPSFLSVVSNSVDSSISSKIEEEEEKNKGTSQSRGFELFGDTDSESSSDDDSSETSLVEN